MKAALIGAGHIARQHLACLREMPGVEIAAVCDLSRVAAEAMADRFSVAKWYTSHADMLSEVSPDVVHITTPPSSHFALAQDALKSGAHVIVEKPATLQYAQTVELLAQARHSKLRLIENYNYLYNRQVQDILSLVEDGSFGDIIHVEVGISLHITAPGSPFVDANIPHPARALQGGPITDFLPHLASLAHRFVGPHKSVKSVWVKRDGSHPLPSDEMRALIDAEQGTAALSFSSHSAPETFSLRVFGSKMTANANLFETRLTLESSGRDPKALGSFLNGVREAKATRRAAYASLWRKLGGGPGAYEGLWELLNRTYSALQAQAEPPVSEEQIRAVNLLIHDITKEASA